MSNQLTPAEPNQNPYEALKDERHKAAVDMRIDGYRLRYIAEFLKLKESWIKEWFMTGGPCHEAYRYRKAEWLQETKELHNGIRQKISDAAVDSVVTLHRNARKGSTIAAKALLEMDGFKPTEKVELTVPVKVDIEYVVPQPLDGPTDSQAPLRADNQAA